jgi:quinol monooxygenase YgiN
VTVNEIARLTVDTAQRAAFVAQALAYAKVLADESACHHVDMLQGVEDPDSFVFLITWDRQQAHETFRGSEHGKQASSTIVSYLAEPPKTSHYASLGVSATNRAETGNR